MSNLRGIFDHFQNPAPTHVDSPFTAVEDQEAFANPFTAVTRKDSPFSVLGDQADARQVESGKPAKIPERRGFDSPFQLSEPSEGFGFEAPAKGFGNSPFEVVSPPFSTAAKPAASPFALAQPALQQVVTGAYNQWQEPGTALRTDGVDPVLAPVAQFSFPNSEPTPLPQAPAFSSAQFTPAPTRDDSFPDSSSIRQLELRAIFGVDREMTPDEILQRSRALPGMKNIARVASQDMATIEALKRLIPNLGFGSGSLKLYSGAIPIEFIREEAVTLAVQTDGGFAPGVRETLMIVARELAKNS